MNSKAKANLLAKIEQAARETRALLAKELGYHVRLQKPAYVAELKLHLEKLAGMRGAAFNS
jgi:hypothetical protein